MAARKLKKHYVTKELEEAAKTFQERNEKYDSAYKKHGHVMDALFPDGITIQGSADQNRMGVFVMIVGKLVRYANNFEDGGHHDSLHDLAIYSNMLKDLDANGDGK